VPKLLAPATKAPRIMMRDKAFDFARGQRTPDITALQ
jgi:hypothetical protein